MIIIFNTIRVNLPLQGIFFFNLFELQVTDRGYLGSYSAKAHLNTKVDKLFIAIDMALLTTLYFHCFIIDTVRSY